MNVKGTKTATSFHKRLGKIMWDYCGMYRNEEGLKGFSFDKNLSKSSGKT